MKYPLYFIAALASLLAGCQRQPEKAASLNFEKRVFITHQNDSLPYRLLYPENYDPHSSYPLVLFLHGAGSRGNDNERQLNILPSLLLDSANRKAFPCFIVAPQCPAEEAWVLFPGFPASIATTPEATGPTANTLLLVDSLIRQLSIDENRIYVTGPSLGGEGTFDIISRRPNFFAAAAPVCGVADTSRAGVVKHVPVWIFHGDQDDVNPVVYSRIMVEALRKAGGTPKYTEYPGVKHDSWKNAYQDPDLIKWMFDQKLSNSKIP